MRSRPERREWISYLRVSTLEQAERELSLPAQRHAVAEYAARHGATIAREYVEAGSSGTNPHRPVFRRMLEDVLRPGSDVAAIVVHHTSRFTRDATQARVVKAKLRRLGVRVLSVCQELTDDPMGKLMEGLFECIDQYESELNGVRTSAAMTEAVRQGFFPGARTPFGYRTKPMEVRPGVTRHVLEVDAGEAKVVRDLYRLYIVLGGAKVVARALNQRGRTYRGGTSWDKHLVLAVLDQTAAIGTHWWGKHHGRRARPREEWVALEVEPIVDHDVYELAQRLRASREPSRAPGRAAAKPHLLSGLVRCGRCGASYQLETSGKKVDGGVYRYCYYNCRNACRAGAEVCPGFRISTDALDAAVLSHVADAVCTAERAKLLARQQRGRGEVALDQLVDLWRTLVATDQAIGRAYLLHLVERVEVHETRIIVTQRRAEPVDPGGRIDWDSFAGITGMTGVEF